LFAFAFVLLLLLVFLVLLRAKDDFGEGVLSESHVAFFSSEHCEANVKLAEALVGQLTGFLENFSLGLLVYSWIFTYSVEAHRFAA